ncbi:MAG: hypothetical protein IJ302_05475, partial [Clostridia bacterium]|nr:hypothetical protein [Clostridia bacterium]
SYDAQSAQIIDIIRDSLTCDFAYSNSSTVSKLGYLPRTVLWTHDSSYMSQYEALKSSAEVQLQEIIGNID